MAYNDFKYTPKLYNTSQDLYYEFLEDYYNKTYGQQQSIEQAGKYKYKPKSYNKSRGVLNRLFSPLNAGQYAVASGARALVDDDPTTSVFGSMVRGLKAGNPFGEWDPEYQTSWHDVLTEAGWEPESKISKLAKGAVGLAGDIYLDPFTYLNPIQAMSRVVKGTGTKVATRTGIKTVKELTLEEAQKNVEKLYKIGKGINIEDIPADVFMQEVLRHQKSFNEKIQAIKHGGQAFEYGFANVPFTSKIKIGDRQLSTFNKQIMEAEKLREIGDKTIAPYFNSAITKLRDTAAFKKFDKYSDFRMLAKFDPIQAAQEFNLVRHINGFDPYKLYKDLAVFKDTNEISKEWHKLSPEQQNVFFQLYDEGFFQDAAAKREAIARKFDKVKKTDTAVGDVIKSRETLDNLMANFKVEYEEKIRKFNVARASVRPKTFRKIASELPEADMDKILQTTTYYDFVKPTPKTSAPKVLEVSSKGDKRFSALYAKVNINGKVDTIENHYQLAKRFGDSPPPKTWREAKGRKPTHFESVGKKYPLSELSNFYDSLWFKYLDDNPELIESLLKYDDFIDSFAKPGTNNQAESIKRYLKANGHTGTKTTYSSGGKYVKPQEMKISDVREALETNKTIDKARRIEKIGYEKAKKLGLLEEGLDNEDVIRRIAQTDKKEFRTNLREIYNIESLEKIHLEAPSSTTKIEIKPDLLDTLIDESNENIADAMRKILIDDPEDLAPELQAAVKRSKGLEEILDDVADGKKAASMRMTSDSLDEVYDSATKAADNTAEDFAEAKDHILEQGVLEGKDRFIAHFEDEVIESVDNSSMAIDYDIGYRLPGEHKTPVQNPELKDFDITPYAHHFKTGGKYKEKMNKWFVNSYKGADDFNPKGEKTWSKVFDDWELNYNKTYMMNKEDRINAFNRMFFGGENIIDDDVADSFLERISDLIIGGDPYELLDSIEDLLYAYEAKSGLNQSLYIKVRNQFVHEINDELVKKVVGKSNPDITKLELKYRELLIPRKGKLAGKKYQYDEIKHIASVMEELTETAAITPKGMSPYQIVADGIENEIQKLREIVSLQREMAKTSRADKSAINALQRKIDYRRSKISIDFPKALIVKPSDLSREETRLTAIADKLKFRKEIVMDISKRKDKYFDALKKHAKALGFSEEITWNELFEKLQNVDDNIYRKYDEEVVKAVNKRFNDVFDAKKGYSFDFNTKLPDALGEKYGGALEEVEHKSRKGLSDLASYDPADDVFESKYIGKTERIYDGNIFDKYEKYVLSEDTWSQYMRMAKYGDESIIEQMIDNNTIYNMYSPYNEGGDLYYLFGNKGKLSKTGIVGNVTDRMIDRNVDKFLTQVNKMSPWEFNEMQKAYADDKIASEFLSQVKDRHIMGMKPREMDMETFLNMRERPTVYEPFVNELKTHLTTNGEAEITELVDDVHKIFNIKEFDSAKLERKKEYIIKSIAELDEIQNIEEVTEDLVKFFDSMDNATQNKFIEISELISDMMEKSAVQEIRTGRLKKEQVAAMRGKYLPRIVTDEARRINIENLARYADSPAGYNPALGGAGYREAFGKSRTAEKFAESNLKMATALGLDTYFEEDLVKILQTRALLSNELVYNDEMVNAVKYIAGKPLNPKLDGYKTVIPFTELNRLFQRISTNNKLLDLDDYGSAVDGIEDLMTSSYEFDDVMKIINKEKAEKITKIYDSLLDDLAISKDFFTPNIAYVELNNSQLDALDAMMRNYSPFIGKDIKTYPVAWQIREPLFEKLNRLSFIQVKKQQHELLNLYDKNLLIYKIWNSSLNPGFHGQNAVSNIFANYMANGIAALNPVKNKRAYQIYKNTNPQKLLKIGDDTLTYEQVRHLATEHGIIDDTFFKSDIRAISGEEGYFKTKFGVSGKIDPTDLNEFVPYKIGNLVGSEIEDTHRILLFTEALENGNDIESAVDLVNKFLFDYGDITPFERDVMKRIIPFYTYMSKNLPLHLNHMLDSPQTYRNVHKLFRGIEELSGAERIPEQERNEWNDTAVQLPFKVKGAKIGWDLNFPYQQFERITPRRLLGQSTPIIKAPVELASGKYLYTGMDIKDPLDYLLNSFYVTKSPNLAKSKEGLAKDLYILSQYTGLPIRQLGI